MLSTIRDVLASSLLFWEIAGYVSTGIVILGCIGEYVAEFTCIPKDDTEKHKLSKLSLIVLTIGIAGELLTAIKSSQISSQVISDLQVKVERAEQSAVSAADAATRANNAADAVGLKVGAVSKEADGAKLKADAAGLKASAVSNKADQIDAELAATQYAFSRRTLPTLASRDQLIEQLKQFKGKTVIVRSYRYMGDVDGFGVCKMVVNLAQSAGMNPIDQCSTLIPGDSPATGINVCGPTDQDMLSLSKALIPLDMSTTCAVGNVPHSSNLQISVGAKALSGIGRSFQTEDAERRATAMKKSNPKAKP